VGGTEEVDLAVHVPAKGFEDLKLQVMDSKPRYDGKYRAAGKPLRREGLRVFGRGEVGEEVYDRGVDLFQDRGLAA